MTIPSGHAVSAALYKTLPYRSIDDFAMISMLTEFPFILVTSAEIEPTDAQGIRRRWRAPRSSPLLFGSAGNGSLQHLAGELLSKLLNVTFQHVPYRGSAQAISDMIARRIDFMVDSPTAEMQVIRARKVRALMVTSKARFFGLPDVPTAAEAGLPDFTFSSWQGMVGPAGLPTPIVGSSQPRSPRRAAGARRDRADSAQIGQYRRRRRRPAGLQGAHLGRYRKMDGRGRGRQESSGCSVAAL